MMRAASRLCVMAAGVTPAWAHHNAVHIAVDAAGESSGLGWALWLLAALVVVGLARAFLRWRRGR